MSHYVYLARWTNQGVKDVKMAGNRMDAFSKDVASVGGNVVSFLYTMGPYDCVAIVNLPSDEAANIVALRAGMRGAATTVTLKGWTNAEFLELAKKI